MKYSINDWVYANFDIVKPIGNELNVCCPFCVRDTKYHMYVSTVKAVAHCHKCGWSGGYIRLIQEVMGTESYVEAFRHLTEPIAGIHQLDTVVEQLSKRRQQSITQCADMPAWYKPFADMQSVVSHHAKVVLRYALKRLSFEDITRYGIGYCSDVNSPTALRLIIPIERGYYQARAINNAVAQKYLNPNIPIDGRLFNHAALERCECVAITEGAISAIATGDCAVATLGANGATSQQRLRLAKSKVREFVIIVEPERVAWGKAIVMADYLVGYGKRVTMRVYNDGDPANSDIFTEQPYSSSFKARSLRK